MKLTFARLIAVILLVIPGFLATYGFLLMKDAIFLYISQFGDQSITPDMSWSKLFLGLLLFACGISFIGGWILFRDRKRNYVAPRFKVKRKPRT